MSEQLFKEELEDFMIQLAEKYQIPAFKAGQIALNAARVLRKDLENLRKG